MRLDVLSACATHLGIQLRIGFGYGRYSIKELPRVVLVARFTMAVNEIPELPDDAGALKPRLLLLYFGQSSAGQEDTTRKRRISVGMRR